MEKRVLLAVVLSFIVLYGSQALLPPPKPQPKPAPAGSTATPRSGAAGDSVPSAEVQGSRPPEPVPATDAPVVADNEERQVTFENASVTATFSTRGGVLTSW